MKKNLKAVIVVDGFSSGTEWLPTFRQLDPSCYVIHVQSQKEIPSVFVPEELRSLSQSALREELLGGYDHRLVYSQLTVNVLHALGYEVLAVLPGTETAIQVVDELAAKLELAETNVPGTSSLRRNKGAQQLALTAVQELGHRPSRVVRTFAELVAFVNQFDLKAFLFKPLESAGSNQMGVFPNFDAEKDWDVVKRRFEEVLGSKDLFEKNIDAVTVEGFVKGVEYQVNGFAAGGKVFFTSIVQYYKSVLPGRGVVPDFDEWLPYEGAIQSELRSVVAKCLPELGLKFGPIHAEVMRDATGEYHVIELANRPPGSRIPSMELAATGKSLMTSLAQYVLNPSQFLAEARTDYDLKKRPLKIALRYFGEPGKIQSLDLFKQLKALPTFCCLIPHYNVGDAIVPSTSLTDNLGLLWLAGELSDDAKGVVDRVREIETKSPCVLFGTNWERQIQFRAVA